MTSFLIRNATGIMTGRAGTSARATVGNFPATDVRVRAGVITEVGRLSPTPGERVYDATDCVVYPGWVNSHHHLFQSLLKGVPGGINLALLPWLTAVPIKYRRFVNEENLRLAATIGIAELLLSGCTTIADHNYCYWPTMEFDGSKVLFDVAEEMGVRFMLLRGGATKVRAEDQNAPPQAAPESVEQMLTRVEQDTARYHQSGGDAMRKMALAPSTPTWSVYPHELKELARGARKMGIMLHSHLSESADYVSFCREVHRTTPVEFCEANEWLGSDVFFAHLVHVTPAELEILARTKTGMAHCPQSNCRLGSGVAPAPALAALGGRVSIGVDGTASNEGGDMINETHTAWYVHRAVHGVQATTVEQVVHWGTQAGAELLGFDKVGVVAPGYQADLVVYALDTLRYAGLHDPMIGPVAAGGDARVKFGFCAGRLVVSNGQIPGLDVPRVLAEARRAVARMAD